MYKVIERFEDRDGRIYEVGEMYEGDRINALSTRRNKYKRIFIEEVVTEKEGD